MSHGRRLGTGSGGGRSPYLLGFAILFAPTLFPHSATAQIEILLRALPPAPPRAGACGHYRFVAEEAAGVRTVEFSACIERVSPASVSLRLWSGDSLSAAIETDPKFFEGQGGSLLDHIRSVEEDVHGKARRLAREDWEGWPGLERAFPLGAAADSSLGKQVIEVGKRSLSATGRRRREFERKTGMLSGVEMTQTATRTIETWTAAEAPFLGLVRGRAEIESERQLARPVPGVPASGPRRTVYRLEWIGDAEGRRGGSRAGR